MIEKQLTLGSLALLLLLVTVASSLAQNEGLAQREEPAVQLRADLVLVPVQVLNKKTRLSVGGLMKEDFVLFEDDVPQQITFFGHDEIPLSVLLLIETYHRTEVWHFDEIFQGTHAIVDRLGPDDHVALMSFDGEPKLIRGFTKDKDLVLQGLKSLKDAEKPEKGEMFIASLLYTSTLEAARYVLEATERRRRRAIIAFTYNMGESLPPRPFTGKPEVASKRRMEREELERRLLERLYKSDIVVCGVIIGYARLRFVWGLIVRHEAKVDRLVKVTGGWMTTAKPEKPVKVDQLTQMIDHLRAQYVLGYVPVDAARDGKLRKIKIELSPATKKKYKDVQLRYRQGYIAASGREGESK